MTPDELATLGEKLADPEWRIRSGEIYQIQTADGRGIIPFVPYPEQWELIRKLLDGMDRRTAIRRIGQLKSRRLGFSTAIGVLVADCLAFRKSWAGSLIDQTQADAAKKMNGIVKVALQGVERFLPLRYVKSNDSSVVIDCGDTGNSEFHAGTRARGGSNDFLWVSEWGPIQFDDPRRSAEIRSGALPSARHGSTVVETTWKGGKSGDFWEIIAPCVEGRASDWHLNFVPWWTDERNVSDSEMDREAVAYFASIEDRLAREGITLSDRQRRWWAAERREQGIFMLRENPTFLDECWKSPVEGSIYGEAIDVARVEKRVCRLPVDGFHPVHTSWDLGSPANTVVWYWQISGREIRVVDVDSGFEGTAAQRVAMMKAKGYNLGNHFLPHDCLQTERSGTTMLATLAEAGLTGCIPIPRTSSIWIGINHLLALFPVLAFDAERCGDALEILSAYRKPTARMGVATKTEPIHDWSSHFADAIRYMAEAHLCGLVKFAAAPDGAEPSARKIRRGMRKMRVS